MAIGLATVKTGPQAGGEFPGARTNAGLHGNTHRTVNG